MIKLPIFIALDVPSKRQAMSLVKKTHTMVRGYKIGPRLYLEHGPDIVKEIKSFGVEIFLDFKFHDIPSATEEAVRSAWRVGSNYVTVHGAGGEETLKRLGRLQKQIDSKGKFTILSVTVLSSVSPLSLGFSGKSEKEIWLSLQNRVEELARESLRWGLKGLICSPLEVKRLRAKYPGAFLMTPGIRLKHEELQDQKRVMTPREALKQGSSALVIGRSITLSKNPESVCFRIAQSLK